MDSDLFPHCFSSLYDFKLDFTFILFLINSSYFTIIYLKNISKYLAIEWKKCSLIDTFESLAKKLGLIKHVQNQTLSTYTFRFFSLSFLLINGSLDLYIPHLTPHVSAMSARWYSTLVAGGSKSSIRFHSLTSRWPLNIFSVGRSNAYVGILSVGGGECLSDASPDCVQYNLAGCLL